MCNHPDLFTGGPRLLRGIPDDQLTEEEQLWLLETLWEDDCGGVTAAPVVQTGTPSFAFHPIQAGQ